MSHKHFFFFFFIFIRLFILRTRIRISNYSHYFVFSPTTSLHLFFHSFGSFSVLRQISECKLKLNTFSISQKSEGAKTNYFSQDKQYENNENGPSLLWCEPFALTNSYTYSNIWGHLSFGRKTSLHIAQIIRLCSFFFIVLGGYSFLPTLVDVRFLIGSQFFMYWSNVRPSSSWRLQLPLRGHIFS